MFHVENGDLIDLQVAEALAAGHTQPIWHARTRSKDGTAGEFLNVCMLSKTAGYAPVYIVHMNTAVEAELLAYVKDLGINVWGETCPQYMMFTEKDMEEGDILLLVKHGPYEFNSFYGKVKTRSRTLVPNFDSMMIELEKGKKFGVFPMVFNDMQHTNFVAFDLPKGSRFNYRTMCGWKKTNPSPESKRVFQFIKKHQSDFSL